MRRCCPATETGLQFQNLSVNGEKYPSGLGKKELAEALDERDQAMIDRLERMRENMLRAVRETTQLKTAGRLPPPTAFTRQMRAKSKESGKPVDAGIQAIAYITLI